MRRKLGSSQASSSAEASRAAALSATGGAAKAGDLEQKLPALLMIGLLVAASGESGVEGG